MPRVNITVRRDRHGTYAWIETRLPGGWTVARRAALAALRQHLPHARRPRIAEQWHVPFKHRAFKVYFET